MYLKLLSECVDEIKGQTKHKTEVKVETSLNAFIPNDYIADYNQRMATYLKISKINTSLKLNNIIVSLAESHGEIPVEVVNLCKIALIKNLCEDIGAIRVILKPRQTQLVLTNTTEKIVEGLGHFSQHLVLENKNQTIISMIGEIEVSKSVDLIINFLEFVVN